VLTFLFSANGGLLRRQLVDSVVTRIDALAWHTTLRLGKRLPERLQPPGLRRRQAEEASDVLLSLEPIRQLVAILRALPGFEPQLLVKRLPRLLGERELRRMGVDLARGLAERGMVRLLRDVLVDPTLRPAPGVASA
jgi:hypothetical protein